MSGGRLLFISNLFPDQREPYRGLDNAVLLRYLKSHFAEVRALGLRPTLHPRTWGLQAATGNATWSPRAEDAWSQPRYLGVPYVPKLGSQLNHRLMAHFLKPALERIRAEFPFTTILCSWLFPDGAALSLLGGAGVPYTLICQGSDAHQYLRVPARKKAILHAVAGSRAVITRSRDLSLLLAEAGADAAKLRPIYNGVDQTLFHPLDAENRAALRRELGLPAAGTITLFVGNFLPVKDPMLLLDAFAQALKLDQSAGNGASPRLLMVGGGPMETEIRSRISELGLGENVRLEGRLDSREVARRMQVSDVLCLSSINEGVPNVVLEAQASGLPVVSTDVGGIGEIIREPAQGVLVEGRRPEDLATALSTTWKEFESQASADRVRANVCKHGMQYAWERAAASYAENL